MDKGDLVQFRLVAVVEEVSICFPFWLMNLMGIRAYHHPVSQMGLSISKTTFRESKSHKFPAIGFAIFQIPFLFF